MGDMNFTKHSACTKCPLHQTCLTVGIPTRVFQQGNGRDRALVIIGEAPGANEDQEGRCWVGRSGGFLRDIYIKNPLFSLDKKFDAIFLANVVRCRPPGNGTPTKPQIKACLPYLWDDLKLIESEYREVWVLATGAPAASAFGHKSLSAALAKQGETQEIPA